jgi:hypothetical protein
MLQCSEEETDGVRRRKEGREKAGREADEGDSKMTKARSR